MKAFSATFVVALVLALSAIVVSPAYATGARHVPSAANIAAHRNFTLTETFLKKYLAVQDDIAKNPCKLSMMGLFKYKFDNRSLDEAAKEWDAKPGVHKMLASHDITAKKILLGMGALLGAASQYMAKHFPKLVHGRSSEFKVSKANMKFYLSHRKEIRQRAHERSQQLMKAHGGAMATMKYMASCTKEAPASGHH